MRYDADRAPKADQWLELDEAERPDAVRRYHKSMGVKGDRAQFHAVVHTAVENQLAQGYPAACSALDRLIAEGLGRHDAVHAIGVALSEQLLTAAKGRAFDAAQYESTLRATTAASWRALNETE